MKAANAHLRVLNVEKFSEAESVKSQLNIERQLWGEIYPLHAPVPVSMMAFEVSTGPNRDVNL